MDTKLLLVISLSIIVSGCIVQDSDSSEQSVTCSSMHLRVADASGAHADVTNLGDDAFGNITVTWEYYNDGAVVKEFETPGGGQTETFESGENSRLRDLNVQHQDCPSRRASY